MIRRALLAVCVLVVPTASPAQESSSPAPAGEAGPAPAFEVTSVKRSGPNPTGGVRFGMTGGRFSVPGMTVGSLITMAYGVQRFQVMGGPGWINSDRFDINAVGEDLPPRPTPPGTPSRLQLQIRSLLKERFALAVHNETRDLPLSYLVMARDDRRLGERLRPSTVDCAALARARAAAGTPVEPPKPGEVPPCSSMMGMGRIAAGSMPMSNLASMLAILLDRPVYDRTGLTGNFEIQVDYTPDQMPQIPPGVTLPPGLTLPSPDGPSLMTALQEQLGLKLESTRGPVDVIVIDSVEQPMPD